MDGIERAQKLLRDQATDLLLRCKNMAKKKTPARKPTIKPGYSPKPSRKALAALAAASAYSDSSPSSDPETPHLYDTKVKP